MVSRGAKTKRDVVSRFRRGEILLAARHVFARKGFDNTTVDAIAKAAGLAKGTVYVYFHSKRELYLAALREGIAALIEDTQRSIEAASKPDEKIQAFITTRIRFAEENKESMALYYAALENTAPACFRKECQHLYQEETRPLKSVFRAAEWHGRARSVRPETAAFFVHELTRALITHRLRGWSRAGADRELRWLLDLIREGLGLSSTLATQGETPCMGSS